MLLLHTQNIVKTLFSQVFEGYEISYLLLPALPCKSILRKAGWEFFSETAMEECQFIKTRMFLGNIHFNKLLWIHSLV